MQIWCFCRRMRNQQLCTYTERKTKWTSGKIARQSEWGGWWERILCAKRNASASKPTANSACHTLTHMVENENESEIENSNGLAIIYVLHTYIYGYRVAACAFACIPCIRRFLFSIRIDESLVFWVQTVDSNTPRTKSLF